MSKEFQALKSESKNLLEKTNSFLNLISNIKEKKETKSITNLEKAEKLKKALKEFVES